MMSQIDNETEDTAWEEYKAKQKAALDRKRAGQGVDLDPSMSAVLDQWENEASEPDADDMEVGGDSNPPSDDGNGPEPLNWEEIFGEPREAQEESPDLDWETVFGEPRPDGSDPTENDEQVAYEDELHPLDHAGRWHAKAQAFANTPDHRGHREDIFHFLDGINAEVYNGHRAGMGMDPLTGRGQNIAHVVDLAKRLGLPMTTPRNVREALTQIGQHLHEQSKKAVASKYWHDKAMTEKPWSADPEAQKWEMLHFAKSIPDEHVHGLAKKMNLAPEDSLRTARHRIASHIYLNHLRGSQAQQDTPTIAQQKTPANTPQGVPQVSPSQLPTRIK